MIFKQKRDSARMLAAVSLAAIALSSTPAFAQDQAADDTAAANPKEIVVTGMMEGQADLYSINLQSKKATRLTDDIYSENMASFSCDLVCSDESMNCVLASTIFVIKVE